MKKPNQKEKSFLAAFHFSKWNVVLFAAGVLVLTIGYWLMSMGPWDNPMSRTVAPLVLLLGYLVIFPLSIFFERKDKNSD